MRRITGAFVMLAVLALLPGFAEPQEPGGRHTGAGMHPEDVLALNVFVPEETYTGLFQDAEAEDSLLPGIRAGVSFSSAPGADAVPGLFHFKQKIEPWFVKVSSIAAAGIDFIIGAERDEARIESLDFEVPEGAADLMYWIRVTEFPDFTGGYPEPRLVVGESVFYINVEIDGGTQADNRVDGEVQWLLTRNFGLFVEYRFLHPGADAEEVAGTAAVRPEADTASHSFLGGVNFRF